MRTLLTALTAVRLLRHRKIDGKASSNPLNCINHHHPLDLHPLAPLHLQ